MNSLRECNGIATWGLTGENLDWEDAGGAVWGQVMQPASSRDFLKVALQRLTAAEVILENLRLTLEAQYIGGYSVECSLKARDSREYRCARSVRHA